MAALIGTVAGAALWARTPAAPSTVAISSPTVPITTTVASPSTTGAQAPSTTAASAPAGSAASADVVTIGIVDFAFDPAMLEIAVGTTVEWVNNDSSDHTVVAGDGSFESETMAPDDTFTFQFTEPGTFPYICGIHPQMTASVVVTG